MQAWLLALLVLIGVCAIGTYYVHNTSSGIFEGFDSSGNLSVYLKKTALAQCNKEYAACMEAGKANNTTCTARYNVCNASAQALDTTVSKTTAPGSATTLSSAAGALAYAKNIGMTGAGDATNWAKSGQMLKWQYGNTKPFDTDPTTTEDSADIYTGSRIIDDIYDDTTPLDPKMIELKKKIEKGYKPDTADFKSAQGLGIITESENDVISLYSRLSDYSARPQKIKPHETPKNEQKVITATLKSDKGTDADNGADTGELASLRSQIRRDIREAVRDEFEEIDNEYEIVYE